MAIILLERASIQPSTSTNGAITTAGEFWVLHFDEFTTPIQANVQVRALESGNEFDFLVVGDLHPDDNTLLITNFTIDRKVEATYTKYEVTTQMTTNSSAANASVKPSRAQDTYSFSHADYEIITSKTTYDSKTGDTEAGEAIENTNGVGIINTETASVIRAVITRNEDDYDLKLASEHVGKINKGTVKLVGASFPAGHCRLIEWAGADAYDSEGSLYWRVTYEVIISDDPAFFEKEYIMRGTTNKRGETAPTVPGLIADTEYKLTADGEFFSKADQADPKKFFSKSFATLEESNWGPPVRLGTSPNANITTLIGPSNFGLIIV